MSTFHPIPWTGDLEVGVPEIDAEHALLVTLYNDVVRAVTLGVSRQTRDGIVRSLRRRHGYPDEAEHRRRHAEFKAAMDALGDPAEGDGAMAGVAGFLHEWILNHIVHDDRALFDWIAQAEDKNLLLAAE